MAIYHYSARVVKRSAGRSSVASAAYRAGDRLRDERTGLLYDYTHRRDFIESFVEAPADAPGWARNRAALWNAVESKERRKDAQLAREVEVALPVELSHGQQRELLRRFVREEFVGWGMVADVCIHRHDRGNPHAHIMLSMRELGPGGVGNKERGWNAGELHGRWRERWADHTNERLREAGRPERVDHRSHKARGVDREPTRHDGPNVRAIEARGLRTDRGEENRQVRRRNEERERQRDHRRDERGRGGGRDRGDDLDRDRGWL